MYYVNFNDWKCSDFIPSSLKSVLTSLLAGPRQGIREMGRDCVHESDKFCELRIKNYSILFNLGLNQPLFYIAYLFPEVISQSDCLNIDARQKKVKSGLLCSR